jgi:hypothetical protein
MLCNRWNVYQRRVAHIVMSIQSQQPTDDDRHSLGAGE